MYKKYLVWGLPIFIGTWLVSFLMFSLFLTDGAKKEVSLVSSIDDFLAPGETTCLILGVDERGDDGGRSDVMLFVRFFKEGVEIISIPRDTYTEVPTAGYTKINHAYAYGKEYLAKRTVEALLGKTVNYTIVINIQQAAAILDRLGGAEVYVPEDLNYDDPYDDGGGLAIRFKRGSQHLNGDELVRYLRYRDGEGDIGRIKRQQEVLLSLLHQSVEPSKWDVIYDLIKNKDRLIKTDASAMALMGIVKQMILMREKSFSFTMLAGYPAYIDQISYWIPEKYKSVAEVRRWRMKSNEGLTREAQSRVSGNTNHGGGAKEGHSARTPAQIPEIKQEEQENQKVQQEEEVQKFNETRERVNQNLSKAQHYLPQGDSNKIGNQKIKIH